MLTHPPANQGAPLSPEEQVRREFADKLLKRLNLPGANIPYGFHPPENLQVIQVVEGKLTGHVYGLPVTWNRGIGKRALPDIFGVIQHILLATASALDDAQVPVYAVDDPPQRGPDGRIYTGKRFYVHNSISDHNNPVAATLIADGKVVSGNLPTKLNIYQISLVMQGLNPGPLVTRATIFVDRIDIAPGVKQLVTPQHIAMQRGDERVVYNRFKAAPYPNG